MKKIVTVFIVCLLTFHVVFTYSLLNVQAEDSSQFNEQQSRETGTGLKDANGLPAEELIEMYSPGSDVIKGIKSDVDKNTVVNLVIPKYIGTTLTRYVTVDAFKGLPNLKTVVIEEGAISDGLGANSFAECPNLESVTLHSPIKQIRENAFRNDTKLKKINFLEGLQTIEKNAFWNCYTLEEIILPDSLTAIGGAAFDGGNSVKKLRIPENSTYKKIEESTFRNFTLLTELEIPTNITEIGEFGFSNLRSLKELNIPNSVTKIGSRAFGECGIESLKLPDSVTLVGTYAFNFCPNLSTVIWGKGATTINDYTLGNIPNLKNVILPNTLQTISKQAFANSGLETITIPSSVTNIGISAFTGNQLKEIIFEDASKITFASAGYTSFGPQKIPLIMYQTQDAYFLDFEQTGIKEWKKINPAGNSSGLFTKIRDGVFKLNDSSNIPVNITYAYNAVDGKTNTQVTGLNLVPDIRKVYSTTFQKEDGTIMHTNYTLEQEEVKFPSVDKKEGFTTVWDDGVINDFNRVFTVSYKAFPKLTGETNISIKKNTAFSAKDYFHFEDADGNKIDDVIFEGAVNSNVVGTYSLNYTATDKWGGKSTGNVKVDVYQDGYDNRELIDKVTQIKVSGVIASDAKLIIELVKVESNVLSNLVTDEYGVVGSYEVTIIGDYTGELALTFPVGKEYEGQSIYIKHKLKDGTIDSYTKVVKDGNVSIIVDELSPFLLMADKKVEDEPNHPDIPEKPNTPDISIKPITPTKPIQPNQPSGTDSNTKVETGDTSSLVFYVISICVAMAIVIKMKRKKDIDSR